MPRISQHLASPSQAETGDIAPREREGSQSCSSLSFHVLAVRCLELPCPRGAANLGVDLCLFSWMFSWTPTPHLPSLPPTHLSTHPPPSTINLPIHPLPVYPPTQPSIYPSTYQVGRAWTHSGVGLDSRVLQGLCFPPPGPVRAALDFRTPATPPRPRGRLRGPGALLQVVATISSPA